MRAKPWLSAVSWSQRSFFPNQELNEPMNEIATMNPQRAARAYEQTIRRASRLYRLTGLRTRAANYRPGVGKAEFRLLKKRNKMH